MRRSLASRAVGLLVLVALVALNGWLVMLNLAKLGRLPAGLESVPGVADALERGEATGTGDDDGEGDGAGLDRRPGDLLTAGDASLPADAGPDDDWPGGRGEVPAGPPMPRRILIEDDGGLRVVGSAPAWMVVADLVDLVGRRLDGSAGRVSIDVSWHPDASDRPNDVEVELASPLEFSGSGIAVTPDGSAVLSPVVELLTARAGPTVVVVGEVAGAEPAGGPLAAVALARVTAVVDWLVAAGVDGERILTDVRPAPVVVEGEEVDGDEVEGVVEPPGGRVRIRFENLLVSASG